MFKLLTVFMFNTAKVTKNIILAKYFHKKMRFLLKKVYLCAYNFE